MRLTLKENPHFYVHLPTSPQEYGSGFKIDPITDFRHADRFYVLTDRPSPVYIKTDQYSRCFGNFWCPNSAIIFKCPHVLFLFSEVSFFLMPCQTSAGGLKERPSLRHPSKAHTGVFVRNPQYTLSRARATT
jgi:hypothetical protein